MRRNISANHCWPRTKVRQLLQTLKALGNASGEHLFFPKKRSAILNLAKQWSIIDCDLNSRKYGSVNFHYFYEEMYCRRPHTTHFFVKIAIILEFESGLFKTSNLAQISMADLFVNPGQYFKMSR